MFALLAADVEECAGKYVEEDREEEEENTSSSSSSSMA
jgi:hypothetical protein